MDYKQNVKDRCAVPYVEFQLCMALELGACRCTCLQGNGISSSVWMDEQLAWYRSTLDRARQDETCGADSGFVETVDVRRQARPWEFGCSACVV